MGHGLVFDGIDGIVRIRIQSKGTLKIEGGAFIVLIDIFFDTVVQGLIRQGRHLGSLIGCDAEQLIGADGKKIIHLNRSLFKDIPSYVVSALA